MSVEFRFLELAGYDNSPHFERFRKVLEARRRECTVLLPAGVDPQRLFDQFLKRVLDSLEKQRYLPIARFCDGEYNFYSGNSTTTCWGERDSDIKLEGVERMHIEALRRISDEGFVCPNLNLVYLKQQSVFLDFLARRDMPLRNYVPFYFVYALLVNPAFLAALRERRVALVTSFANKDAKRILASLASKGIRGVECCEIPPSGVAHGEFDLKLNGKPDVALVGAGIGSPLVLARLREQSCPAIDSGFVFHLWDGTFDRYERLFLNYVN
jgi:hypothetical protein